MVEPTPDATLDGLLRKRDEACYRHEVAEANAAIHAHCAQREAALRDVEAAAHNYRRAWEMVSQREAALRADNERLRKAMEQAKEQLTEAARFCGSRLIRADLDNIYYDINAALASPCAVPPKPRQVPPHTVGGPASGYGP